DDEATTIENQMTGEREEVHPSGWARRRMIAEAKQEGGPVVVCSPVPRNAWTGEKVVREMDYRAWAEQAASAGGAYFVDLNALVAARYDGLGREAVATVFATGHPP